MNHEKPKPPAMLIGLLIVALLLMCGGGVLGVVGFVTYKRIEAERQRAVEAELRAVETLERAIAAEREAEAARLQRAEEASP